MPTSPRWMGLVLALAFCLLLPFAVAAQAEEEPPEAFPLPELDGLAWYRAIDTDGTELAETQDEEQLAAWTLLAERVDADLDELEYSFLEAFDPSILPDLGAIATVRVAGAETAALREAVVQDIVDQVVASGLAAPTTSEVTVAGRDVALIPLAGSLDFYEEAIVYAADDVAYVLLLPRSLAEQALARLP